MANIFLNQTPRDVETAIMLEQALVYDLDKAVAYTDGDRVFLNTDDNLAELLPAYDPVKMKKWLLWHERYHKELRHHNRFYRYLNELKDKALMDEFYVTKEEVNIIMDILVHDSLSKMFPELVEVAKQNLAQMRDQNSLKYTFKTFTLEEMLDEYRKEKEDRGTGGTTGDEPIPGDDKKTKEGIDPSGSGGGKGKGKDKKRDGEDPTGDGDTKGHGSGGDSDGKRRKDEGKPEEQKSHHDDTDWSKLKEINSDEFITKDTGDYYQAKVAELKRKRIRLAKLTETLNGLVTTTRKRSYSMPSPVHVGHGVILKGSTPGRAQLALCFDASGSMGSEMQTFKDIISKSIPQAMKTPTTWFSGYSKKPMPKDPTGRNSNYYKGTFEDFMPVWADSGYADDGDRTIELCLKAEQTGLSPIGVTDFGGGIDWSEDMLKQLKRTVFVTDNDYWSDEIKKLNPNIQVICI